MTTASRLTLVCFAVPEEAAAFRRTLPPDCEILVTRMGPGPAERHFRDRLRSPWPSTVLTCGFAGALDPALRNGTVVFDCDPALPWAPALRAAGALPARFHCARRVAVTVEEKTRLRQTTGADVVEMESGVIRRLCREQGLPSATVRVISDQADEDLPVDFNDLMRPDGRLHFPRLLGRLLRSPGRLGRMIRLGRTTAGAARNLAGVLLRLLGPDEEGHGTVGGVRSS